MGCLVTEEPRPAYVVERIRKARVRSQLASLQYILANSSAKCISSATGLVNVDSLEAFVRSLYPFPQDLEKEAIALVLRDTDLAKKVTLAYDTAKLIAEQEIAFRQIRAMILGKRSWASIPDPKAPNTLGWRGWKWDPEIKVLVSPAYQAFWEGPELRVTDWDTSEALRSHKGIHAKLVPHDWKVAIWGGDDCPDLGLLPVTGIVERFGRFVLGTLGWRAEWVIIRKLLAPTQELGFELERAYPDVEVCYFDTKQYGAY
jgi:hypothetical protein